MAYRVVSVYSSELNSNQDSVVVVSDNAEQDLKLECGQKIIITMFKGMKKKEMESSSVHSIMSRFYNEADQFGETFVIKSDSGVNELGWSYGERVILLPVKDKGDEFHAYVAQSSVPGHR